jgi:hypothetical protein
MTEPLTPRQLSNIFHSCSFATNGDFDHQLDWPMFIVAVEKILRHYEIESIFPTCTETSNDY